MKSKQIVKVLGLICISLGINFFCAKGKKVTIIAPEANKFDEGCKLACEYVTRALQSKNISASVVWIEPETELPAGDLILVGSRKELAKKSWQASNQEEYRISPF